MKEPDWVEALGIGLVAGVIVYILGMGLILLVAGVPSPIS